jgi:hypothetical protein
MDPLEAHILEERVAEAGFQPVEVLRYEISEGRRRVMARRTATGHYVYDIPVGPDGYAWRIDEGCVDFFEVAGFLSDYAEKAEALDCCPMSRDAIEAVWGPLIDAA